MMDYITVQDKTIRIPTHLYDFLREFAQKILYPVHPKNFAIPHALPMFAHADLDDGATITMFGKAGQDMYVEYVYPAPGRAAYLYKLN